MSAALFVMMISLLFLQQNSGLIIPQVPFGKAKYDEVRNNRWRTEGEGEG